MKIIDIVWEKYKIDMLRPFKIAFTEFTAADNIIVKVITDEGLVGYGEAAPFTPVTGETTESVIAVLKLLKPALIGKDPFQIEAIHALMNTVVYGNGSAKCAIDMAMYDLMGKATNTPVYKLLGGYQNKVQTDITVSIYSTDEMVNTAYRYVKEDGFRILKIKAGIDVASDIETIGKIRAKVGDDIRLRVDANQGYTIPQALEAIEGFKKYGVEAVEQCLPYWDLQGSKALYQKTSGIQLMQDESIHGTKDAFDYVTNQCSDILNIKLMKCGGLLPASKINSIAETAGVNCMVGCMFESKLSIAAGVSLVAAKKNITEADCDSFMFQKDPDRGFTGGFIRDKDIFTLSDRPGLGVDVNF